MKAPLAVLALCLLLPLTVAARSADRAWKGWITDSRCGAAGAHPGDKECAKSCVKKGAKYVFVDDTSKKVYLLDPQEQVEVHAGDHVQITGALVGHVLKFTAIQPTD